ncbi:MAG: hypothetical protein AAGE52_24755 [Myxococcota bacterium]
MREALCRQAEIAFDPYEPTYALVRRLATASLTVGSVHLAPAARPDWAALLLRGEESATERYLACLAGLHHLGSWNEDDLFLDTLEDHGGAYRVYGVHQTVPYLIAADVDEFLDMLAADAVSAASGDDSWSTHHRSADRVLPLLHYLSPLRLFAAHRRRQWINPPKPPRFAGFGPAWIRGALVYVLARFFRDRKVVIPESVNEEAFSEQQRDLLTRLRHLEYAIDVDDVPETIGWLALDESDDTSMRAQQWMETFDEVRAKPADVGSTEKSPALGNQEVRSGLVAAVKELTHRDLLELEAGQEKEVEDELTQTFFRMLERVERGFHVEPNEMLQALVDALIDSEHVVDVYGEDDDLRQAFRIALGS